MKTLQNAVILYDGDCPLCRLYTKGFVSSGMLPEGGREAYQTVGESVPCLDRDRAVNEIALVDRKTGVITYGVQSLFAIIGHSFPILRPLFRFPPFAWLTSIIYRFVSYNRRVIMPARRSGGAMPEPARKVGYRVAYLVMTWLVTALILSRYSCHLEGLVPASRFYREFLVCGGQVLWQGAVVQMRRHTSLLDYLGNLMTISFGGGLALLMVGQILTLAGLTAPIVYAAVFMAVAGLMFLEHLRRASLLGWGSLMSVGWVAYRAVVLLYLIS